MVSLSKRQMVLSTASALALSACGSSSKNKEPEAPLVPIKSVAIIPATPIEFGFEYSASLFVPPIVRGIINGVNAGIGRSNAMIFNDKFADQGFDLSKQLTTIMAKQLQDAGLVVEVLNNIRRRPKDPDNIDYTKLVHNSEVILHLYFNEMVFQTPRGQSAFWPRASTTVQVYDKTGKYMFEDGSYLDRGAKESRAGYFDAKDEMAYPSQEVMIEQYDKVRADVERYISQAAQFLSKRVLAQGR